MKWKQMSLIGLGVWLAIARGITAMPTRYEPTPTTQWLADSDADGVADDRDLCPNTAPGIPVNGYGCPTEKSQCDYTTETVTLKSTGGSPANTRFILADSLGTIRQISSTPTFTGLTGSVTYMALSLVYDGTVSNLSVGQPLSGVQATCLDWSDALMIRVCVPSSTTCDYQIGEVITLKASGGSSGPGVKTSYVLTDADGKLVQVTTTPVFPTAGLAAGSYRAYALTYSDDNSISRLLANDANQLSQVTANCLALSPAQPILLCGECQPYCLPITIVRIR